MAKTPPKVPGAPNRCQAPDRPAVQCWQTRLKPPGQRCRPAKGARHRADRRSMLANQVENRPANRCQAPGRRPINASKPGWANRCRAPDRPPSNAGKPGRNRPAKGARHRADRRLMLANHVETGRPTGAARPTGARHRIDRRPMLANQAEPPRPNRCQAPDRPPPNAGKPG
jgi:hypothetical protein